MMFDNDVMKRVTMDIFEARAGRALLGMTDEEQEEFMKANKHDFVKVIGDK
jgi:hypothetical protein